MINISSSRWAEENYILLNEEIYKRILNDNFSLAFSLHIIIKFPKVQIFTVVSFAFIYKSYAL